MASKDKGRSWIRQHLDDPYVRRSRAEGRRSRAAYKLIELDDRHRLLQPGGVVVDLGAAPGGWSQVAAERVGSQGRVVALDILAMDPIPGVELVQGDFREGEALERVQALLDGRAVDVVLSDMAPSLSGVKASDRARAEYLTELAADFADSHLRVGGALVVKVFHGAGFEALRERLRLGFRRCTVRKPGASRDRSAEVYLVAEGFGV